MTDDLHEFEQRIVASMRSAMTTVAETVVRNVSDEFRAQVEIIARDAVNRELHKLFDILRTTANSAAEAVQVGKHAVELVEQVAAGLIILQREVTQLRKEHNDCPHCGSIDDETVEAS